MSIFLLSFVCAEEKVDEGVNETISDLPKE